MAAGEPRDRLEHLVARGVRPETFTIPSIQYLRDRVLTVPVEADAVADRDARANALVEIGEQVDLVVRDADPREPAELVEVREQLGLAQLVDLVEDDDGRAVEVPMDAIE